MIASRPGRHNRDPFPQSGRGALRRYAWGVVVGVCMLAVTAACGGGTPPAAGPSGAQSSRAAPASSSAPARATVAIPSCEPVKVPPFDAAGFLKPTKIDNKWFPLAPGTQFVMEGRSNRGGGVLPHQIVFTVTDLTKVINGVETVVLWDVDTNRGILAESELAFFAQDRDGNVWTMGEYPEEYSANGSFTGAPKTWIAGLDQAEAGVQVRAEPRLGSAEYLQGVAPKSEFLDCAKDVRTGEHTCVSTACYDNVLVVDERSVNDPASGIQRKFYAPGVGNVQVQAIGDPEGETLVLVRLVAPNPGTLASARKGALDLEKHAYEVNAVYKQTAPSRQRE